MTKTVPENEQESVSNLLELTMKMLRLHQCDDVQFANWRHVWENELTDDDRSTTSFSPTLASHVKNMRNMCEQLETNFHDQLERVKSATATISSLASTKEQDGHTSTSFTDAKPTNKRALVDVTDSENDMSDSDMYNIEDDILAAARQKLGSGLLSTYTKTDVGYSKCHVPMRPTEGMKLVKINFSEVRNAEIVCTSVVTCPVEFLFNEIVTLNSIQKKVRDHVRKHPKVVKDGRLMKKQK
nr:MAG: hypothetical protein [Bee densovirus 1]